ncbi:hypothetical protein SAMN05216420_101139 [Nitrosospira sp. Nl5]|uniref:hypothetical protein n=1 Tax=Nitrosospira sp. Nl5 TaxID=200120 RepID=UPI00088213B8|nr:hypothetical protein [Nitrosospira sp. Nl5]SCX86320.1 hypothetical protein SAMN05216420_101139 [Nitrosospira sp. Nl5]
MLSLLKILRSGFAVILIFVPLVLFMHLDAFAQTKAEAIPFMHEKTYLLPSGKSVAIKFRERPCESAGSRGCSEADAGTWGTDGGVPRFLTEVFLVSIDGREFVIPEKFYKDLTNTYHLNAFEQKTRVIIELKGGEAAGAYTARFTLGGTCGFERKVCGEVCGEIWERTTWYNAFAYEAEAGCESGIQ